MLDWWVGDANQQVPEYIAGDPWDYGDIFGTDDEAWDWDLGGLWSGVQGVVGGVVQMGQDVTQMASAVDSAWDYWNPLYDGVSREPIGSTDSGAVHPNIRPIDWRFWNWGQGGADQAQGQDNSLFLILAVGLGALLAFS